MQSLRHILQEREPWRGHIESLKRMRQWVLEVEGILDGSWAGPASTLMAEVDHPQALPYNPNNKKEAHRSPKMQYRKQEQVTNEQVGRRLDHWRAQRAV